MNVWRRHEVYTRAMHIDTATDSIARLQLAICQANELTRERVMPGQQRVVVPDFEAAQRMFIKCFRTGEFGDQFLDDDIVYGVER
jgi:hypothetical protein